MTTRPMCQPGKRRVPRLRSLLLLTSAVSLLVALLAPMSPAQAFAGAPWFEPGTVYTQNFPDPSVLKVDNTYYAYSTSTGGNYVPIMSSTDLVNWVAHPRYTTAPPPWQGSNPSTDPAIPVEARTWPMSDVAKWNFNDGLVAPASWSNVMYFPDGHYWVKKDIWAPSALQVGPNAFVLYYAIRVQSTLAGVPRYCVTRATSTSPMGPFRDDSGGPLQCDVDPGGSIDPQAFRAADGTPYLLWKSAGIDNQKEATIYSRPLAPDGRSFAPFSQPVEVLRNARQGWENVTVENPSMIYWNGSYILFYSAGAFETAPYTPPNVKSSATYATGYATCSGPQGPCFRWAHNPIMRTDNTDWGPGAATAFVDGQNQLRLMYHSWNPGYTQYPDFPACLSQTPNCTQQGQRRMHVKLVTPTVDGLRAGPPLVPPFASTQQFIRQQWMDFYAMNATSAEQDFMASGIESGSSPVDLMTSIFLAQSAPVTRLYMAYFLRQPDDSGHAYWLNRTRSGYPIDSVSQFFSQSDEFRARYGPLANAAFVDLVYQNVLSRAPDAGGRTYWLDRLNGGLPRGSMMLMFSDATEYRNKNAAAVVYYPMLRRLPSPAEALQHYGQQVSQVVAEVLASAEYDQRT